MDISTSSTIATQISNKVNGVSSQQQPVKRVELEREQNPEQKNQQTQRSERFDVDPQALALVEKEYQNNQVTNFTSSASTNNNTAYDNPSEQNQTAISTYQGVGNLAQKESIKQLFGIDLYA